MQFFEKVIAFVVDHDEGWEILNFHFPDRFHAEFRIFEHLDFFDAVLSQARGRATD